MKDQPCEPRLSLWVAAISVMHAARLAEGRRCRGPLQHLSVTSDNAVAKQTSVRPFLFLYKTCRMSMHFLDASTLKRFTALLAVAALHFLVLVMLPKHPLPSFLPLVRKDNLLVITLLSPEKPVALPLAVIVKRLHATPLLRPLSNKPKTLESTAPAIESTSRVSAPEEKPRKEAMALEEDKTKTIETVGDSNTGSLHRDSIGSRSNIGAVDQRWLPREIGTLQQGTARPDLPARTPQEVLEQTLSRAARGDCRTKHAHMGLLAIPFLVTDTVSDTGCKW